MRFRQVHLDFHTSEKINGIGENFSKEQFQNALREGHVNSITVFSKCHHGWAYHPSVANVMHPGLSFDLLKAEIDAAHEIGVKTPVYLSVGFDEKIARVHPEWLIRRKDDMIDWQVPMFHELCLNSPYLDIIISQIEEVVKNYDCDGIFLDIVGVRECYCQNCVRSMLDAGLDPYDSANAKALGEKTYAEYTRRVREAIDKYKPGLPVFHNGGHIRRGRRDLAHMDTHLELESLPTGGWGYDHFPLSAAYARTLGMEFLGMTGKFHTHWGEFGGFKHPNALRYEEALCVACGAKCSIGDQMHPDGYMDMATYRLIGKAYSEVEKLEKWLDGVSSVADIAILSDEAVSNYYSDAKTLTFEGTNADVGAVRIMLEGKYLFDVIDTNEDLDKYKLVVLPDSIRLDDNLTSVLKRFVSKGGKILATGESGLKKEKDEFALDLGAEYCGKSEYRPVYFRPQFDLGCLDNSAFVIYSQSYDIKANGDILVTRENPYFNRTTFEFCSHQHTPNNKKTTCPAVTVGHDGAYISTDIFNEYATKGSLISKLIAEHVIDTLLGENKTLRTSLPAQGVVTLMEQKKENRLVNHLLYASPVKRGQGIEVIEDIVPLYGVEVSLKSDRKPSRVYLAPDEKDIPFEYADGEIKYLIEKLENHAVAVIEFD